MVISIIANNPIFSKKYLENIAYYNIKISFARLNLANEIFIL